MNATLARKLRFSDVVYAIKTTPKSLRLWLQRDLVELHSPRPESGWTEYSFIDIAILALTRTFVNFGVNVPTASELANTTLNETFPKMLHLGNPEKMPAAALALLWANMTLRVYPDEDGANWHLQFSRNWDPSPEPAHAYLKIDVAPILKEAFERAVESANDGASE